MKLDTFFKKIIFTLGIVSLTLGTYFTISSFMATEKNENTTITPEKSFKNDYNIFAIDLPEEVDFAGERTPLEITDIKERLDKELLVNTYWQSNALLLIKRSHKYFPIIEPILKEYEIPEDFKYLAVAESGLEQVVSHAGATGFWQIMEATAQEYGLEVNDNVDERYHIEKATRVACEYLKKSKERFGSWTLAAAAYNAGNYGISKEMNRQEVENYYDLLLNPETSRYVFRIIALKHILSNPKEFGFHFEEKDLYEIQPLKTVEVDTAVTDFVRFAEKFNMNYKTLKIHNPWLRDKHLDNYSKKVYSIKVLK
ncbi:lytic transglycosylase domain-containing protein [Psychroflexus sediminis]|uniref:Transglycosylase SLT domain-containing protein n=1 Tax=Psychroflexus sediminis TaxID=470826 RepID=A0A1G7XSJ1_9FLAO|nr:lytic transglycosylase domain-containing protein [Psychroflexus sediminis]SDG87101.1 Transglycosylase SLT domain-containing protein [Psychroflexus sediminis]